MEVFSPMAVGSVLGVIIVSLSFALAHLAVGHLTEWLRKKYKLWEKIRG
jgi:hypothetical protein